MNAYISSWGAIVCQIDHFIYYWNGLCTTSVRTPRLLEISLNGFYQTWNIHSLYGADLFGFFAFEFDKTK